MSRHPAAEPEHLFVYGTLLSGAGHPMHAALARDAVLIGRGTIRGRLFEVATYPGLTDRCSPEEIVHGEVYRLAADHERRDALLRRLDAYEGCGAAAVAPPFRREARAVRTDAGAAIDAWVYLYNLPTSGLRRIASGDYMERERP